ncbi:MAG: 3-deoxy-manno-octulosonate cytidylyltransferase [Blastocatellia bacterium]|nr:3-deoxy-manno-octulosonate cytidylyltransferase [Blastocatellia bacterium]MCS7156768.1 3-deoxy-manno-octulosonate cytidylyltransferase [Blastocatellia bacterium]MCX7752726.1 3-deoxy-manno-octulosonate cytidylyltransferase [Blastocatellia bacterium]MDW8167458.1 3-deoxy-manno-octulosonate cytidylyltransferase [Acidobacteriota bacterium]MDW8256805.1 3-deoxy-manno-octulosonate cytidylyltransferase [Acidobacteriota bacterium]
MSPIFPDVARERIVVIIPARYASQRLPGKPLLEIGGRPMILHVYERARCVPGVERVLVATDDERIADVVQRAGGEALLTSARHRSGTERVAEAAAHLEAEIIVNVQGDEPLIKPEVIAAALNPVLADPHILMATTSEPVESIEEVLNPNVVKVVTDREGFALYFSRQPIPWPREAVRRTGSLEAALRADSSLLGLYRRHTGLYVYRRELLQHLAAWPPTPLEEAEQLEQLRALEHGVRIKVVPVTERSMGVDTPEDLERVRALLATR